MKKPNISRTTFELKEFRYIFWAETLKEIHKRYCEALKKRGWRKGSHFSCTKKSTPFLYAFDNVKDKFLEQVEFITGRGDLRPKDDMDDR